MTRIKICGVTRIKDLAACIEAGVDGVGLNFVSHSPRYLADLRQAAELAAELRLAQRLTVGVFARCPLSELQRILDRVQLDVLQLHGDEDMDYVEALRGVTALPLWKAVRVADEADLSGLETQAWPAALLFDARVGGHLGGSGKTFDWDILKAYRARLSKPWVLAGGLHPDNVADGVRTVKPDWVDTASGVESAPAIKDSSKIKRFVAAVRCV